MAEAREECSGKAPKDVWQNIKNFIIGKAPGLCVVKMHGLVLWQSRVIVLGENI